MSNKKSSIKNVLVTGASGFLGEHVVRGLRESGDYKVTTFARSLSPALRDSADSHVRGDILEGPQLASALKSCDAVFHLAGMVSRNPEDTQSVMRVHVEGTRRLMRLAGDAKVRRVVISSSSGTLAVSKEAKVHDESAEYASEVAGGWPYYASKIFQEKVALELGAELGIEVVIVNPSLLLGPGDSRLSSTRDVQRFIKGRLPVIPTGGINFVDVRDAASATIAAMKVGKSGERYLLGGPNWTFEEFFDRLARVAQVSAPRFKVPARLQKWGASAIESLYRSVDREAPVDRISVEMGQHYWWIDSSKAQRELEFKAREASVTLVDTVNDLRRGL